MFPFFGKISEIKEHLNRATSQQVKTDEDYEQIVAACKAEDYLNDLIEQAKHFLPMKSILESNELELLEIIEYHRKEDKELPDLLQAALAWVRRDGLWNRPDFLDYWCNETGNFYSIYQLTRALPKLVPLGLIEKGPNKRWRPK
jgi:hypothetical protein